MLNDTVTAAIGHWGDVAQRWGVAGGAAALIMLFGWSASGWAERAAGQALRRVKGADAMVAGFFASLARWSLLVFTGLAALERLGVRTTSVVAVVGAAGLAVGLAMQNTLASLAAGVMLLLFRPFRVGDSIECGTVAGSVRAVTLFHTELVTGEHVLVVAPNSLLWGTTLRNLSALSDRRLTVTVPVPYPADVEAVVARIRELLAREPRIASEPGSSVTVARFGEKTCDIEVQAWCAASDAGALKADLMTVLWRECLKDLVERGGDRPAQ